MFASLALTLLIPIFIVAAAIVWIAGIQLSNATDTIDWRFGFGEALGGLIFLAVATNLPEIAIIVSASLTHHIGIAIGNILGGIAIQTVVLVILDGFGLGQKAALTYQAASLQLVLEGILVICVLVISIMGAELPRAILVARLAPGDLLIVATWLIGLWLINKARQGLPWHEKGHAPDTLRPKQTRSQERIKKWSTMRVLLVFIFASLATLAAGVVLEESGSAIAANTGWSGVLFGSTILAAATALPEVSTGLAAVKIGDYTLAFSDIFGGNAFLPTLFLLATLLSGVSVLPYAQGTDIYLASLGALLTAIYIYGLIFRPKRQLFCLGIDSIVVLLVYIVGIIGLFTISGSK
ncbi:MAG TPA: sodium:calcium antiporter [Gammaproteobacteria bacterium]|jgi:cation:H+ antiporter|nr:sodium:calcium antiporter [Gammaproteobacteria bacterium]